MINVRVKLFASLRRGRFESKEFSLREGSTMKDLARELSLPPDDVSIIFINNRHAPENQQLREGDIVALFPPVGGG